MIKSLLVALAALTAAPAWAAGKKTELWVYVSIYKEFAAPIEAAFEKAHPDVDVQIFQAGSEKLQAKVEAELLAKKPQADVVLTSDPFWALDLESRGLLYARPGHPAAETDYYGLMVLVAHKDLPADKRPKTFQDLAKPELKGQVQLGSPLESGTTFSSVAFLSRKYGWDYFQKLRANGVGSAGGNSTVIQKVESGEKKVGMVLLENALAAQKRGSPLEIIYPEDGSIPLPSVQIILKDSPKKEVAAQFADFVISKEGQQLLRNGFMYAVHPEVPAPEGAKPLAEVAAKPAPWTPDVQKEVATGAKDIKKKFAALILD